MKAFFKKYKHAWVFLYALIYFPWFGYLEQNVTHGYHIINTALDQQIPFIEYFVVPYLLWFVFMVVTTMYIFFTDKSDFYRMAAFAIIGMTIFLIISTIYPNGQILRPTTFERDNIFVNLVKIVYAADTPTNIFPSLHVYNSLGAYLAIRNSKSLKDNKVVQYGSLILTILIILSTVFLKQHSVIDVVGAFLMAIPIYHIAYSTEPKHAQLSSKIAT